MNKNEREEKVQKELHEKMVAMGLRRKADGTFENPPEGGKVKVGWSALRDGLHGTLNPELVCPHCQTKGQVRAQKVDSKTGAGGVFAALFTVGLSLLVAPKDTLAHCGNCKTEWRISK